MFEGLVQKLILGYLGRYIKDFQKEQLKITIWSEEVYLENVELILEAFDYLQLPFALQNGRVGKLSIKIPWKKLGWDPIIIVLEDVFISACQREEKEWRMEAIERREYAGKKAKLAAAELGKLSRRVCDNGTGQSFISYITAKILDGIQVSIRNVHILYCDMLSASAATIFGLKFSSLTISRQNLVGFSGGRVKGGQVNKLIEVQGLELYCRTMEGTLDLMSISNGACLKYETNATLEGDKHVHLLCPLDVLVSLSVNRSGKLENDAPQYYANIELVNLVASIDEVHMQKILMLFDYISTCRLREKYGRYRPWWSPLREKLKGWQIAWWHYAQGSVLADVRKSLKRTSWKYLGERLNERRKYMKLYKTKLKCLHREQAIDENVLQALEEMEKLSDIDDILSYRSAAEREIKDILMTSHSSNGSNGANVDLSLEDERPSSKPRGWLNWLSRGMLGAGGTDDSGQFSGVISDEVIKDIYEATKFHPVPLFNGDTAPADEILLSPIKISIHQTSLTMQSMRLDCAIAHLMLDAISFECKIWEVSTRMTATILAVQLLNPLNNQVILCTRKMNNGEIELEIQPSLTIEVEVLPPNCEFSSSIKVSLQPSEVTCDFRFLRNILDYFQIFGSFKFLHERVLLSVNEIVDLRTRLLSKIDYILSNRKMMMWDVSLGNSVLTVPWVNDNIDEHRMVINVGFFRFKSKKASSLACDMQDGSYQNLISSLSSCSANGLVMPFQLDDLYTHYEIDMIDFEVKLSRPYSTEIIPLFEKFRCSIHLKSCLISDESILKALDLHIRTSSLLLHFSPSIFGCIMGLITYVNKMHWESYYIGPDTVNALRVKSNGQGTSVVFWCSLTANIESVHFKVDLENNEENGDSIMLGLRAVDVSFDLEKFLDCWLSAEVLRIVAYSKGNEETEYMLCSPVGKLTNESSSPEDRDFKFANHEDDSTDRRSSAIRCLQLHFGSGRGLESFSKKCSICLTNLDIHYYPVIVMLLVRFINDIVECGISTFLDDSRAVNGKISISGPHFNFQKFGFSNFVETGSSEEASIPLDYYPFITIRNSGSLVAFENLLIEGIPQWRKARNLRAEKIQSHKFSFDKGSKCYYALLKRSEFNGDPLWKSSDSTDMFNVEINLRNVKLHLHDSACVIGSISLVTGKASGSISDGCFDILCSTEGLVLSSSWWTQTISGFLWGPILPNLSPILNIRARKEPTGSLDLSFSAQHVSCTLPPELLAVLIGYFSSKGWSSSSSEKPMTSANSEHMDLEVNGATIYKFEIVDSNLFVPVVRDSDQLLKLDIQHFLGCFVKNSDSDLVLKGIPLACPVLTDKISNRNHCLNLFGRDLSLSLVLKKDDLFDSSRFGQLPGHLSFSLVSPFSADVWVRFPLDESSNLPTSCPIYIIAAISNCQIDAWGTWTVAGYEALLDIINEFSLVDMECKLFKSDLLRFLESKKRMRENTLILPENSAVVATEISLFASSVSIRLHSKRGESTISELVAEVETQFFCSASLPNDKQYFVDISLSHLTLFSSLNSVVLVEFMPSNSSSSSAKMTLTLSDMRGNKLCVSLTRVNAWMHMFDWREIMALLDNYKSQTSKISTMDVLPENTHAVENVAAVQSPLTSSFVLSENPNHNAAYSAAKLEGICITTYIPVLVNTDIFSILEEPQVQIHGPPNESADIVYCNQHDFIAVTMEGRCSEIVNDGNKMMVTIRLEKVGGMVNICKNNAWRTWSFFELFLVNMEAEVLNHLTVGAEGKFDIYFESLDVWLSNNLFYFIRYMLFEVPESEPSQPIFNSFGFNMQLRKLSILLNDGKWSSCGPLVEILMTNMLLLSNITNSGMEGSVGGDLLVNYNNIDKVSWEPFVEPWEFQLSISRKYDKSSVLNSAIMTHIHVKSTKQLNLNVTESLIEVVSRTTEMIKDVWALPEITAHSSSAKFFDSQITEELDTRRYAPYILQNLTSLPLVFHVCDELGDDGQSMLASNGGNFLKAGSSVPIYIDEGPKKQLFPDRPTQSSDKHCDKQTIGAAHRFIIIQLEGTSVPSAPISMDLVGVRYVEVDLSKPSTKSEIGDIRASLVGSKRNEADGRTDTKSSFLIPVVIDVSVQRYTKLLRLYSPVVFSNATSMPLEVRFDIPFGVSPKILDPVYPGKEFPLPLHLAEAGRIRWRPLGDTYLWSEAYNVSNIVDQENRINLPRSFVCYPSHPSSDPFRCCISVDDRCLPATSRIKKNSDDDSAKLSIKSSKELSNDIVASNQRFIHLVTLNTPLLLRNFLPEAVSVDIENGGVTRSALLSKVETSFFHIDSSHDLTLTFSIQHFKPSVLKFPRAETFSAMAKFSGTKFSLSETLTFDSQLADGPLSVTMERVMDAISGAREISVSVPILIYNCVGFPLILTNSVNEIKGHCCTVASSYYLDEPNQIVGSKDGLSLLFSGQDSRKAPVDSHLMNGSLTNQTATKPHEYKFYSNPLNQYDPSKVCHLNAEIPDLDVGSSPICTLNNESCSCRQLNMNPGLKRSDFVAIDHKMENCCIYSPSPTSTSGEIMVRLSRCPSDIDYGSIPSSSWSNPFLLVPPTGSTSVIVPRLGTNAGYLVSVSAVAAPFSGRTKIITFQPRYVISNACSRDLFYKQKGTDAVFLLKAGQHCHIQCTDITRELLVCIRFYEPGWQWSGCFSPEYLGDTQLKVWNYVSGSVNMMRVEVQSADVSIEDEKIVGNAHGNSGTNLILLSDDDTSFMPYRIDNFSKERLRIYQQRCEIFETMVHPYTCHPYAWDEPFFPHRLTVEVLGERVIGLYSLDDVKDYSPVYLPATLEKSQRTLLVSVHSEGAIKVLSIIDSSYHVLNDLPNSETPQLNFKRKSIQKRETFVHYSERISVDIPFVGISFMNSYNEELLFACAKNSRIDLIQSIDQQKFCFHISFLQIDNQLPSTPYPVILSFDHCNKSNKDKIASAIQIDAEGMNEPVISLSVAKWRTKNLSLVSFEHINLRVTDFHLELEQELILSLLKFFKTISSRFQTRVLEQVDSTHYPSVFEPENVKESQFSALYDEKLSSSLLPLIVPIGAPWQQIHLLARKQKKTYFEVLDLAPIKMTLSFSSSPWMLRNAVLPLGESLIHRGFMALADVEGAQIYLKELVLSHQLASWESIQEILIRHYTKQSLHEMYKIFGSAGLIGNPMGFVRSMSLGIKDFLSVPVQSILQSPSGLLTGVAQGTTSLLSNTVYAISDAATQFSRAAHKGIVAFTLDDQTGGHLEKQQKGISSNSKGVINEFLQGLTGLLQSPVRGAEKHGLPGVLSGIALGVTGLVAKPAASILEVTGKTAQSIRNRSKLPHMGSRRLRVRLPRPLVSGIPLKPYSWEEAVGTAVLRDSDSGGKLRNQILIMCKALRQGGKFIIITPRFVLVVGCSSLVDLGKPEFQGVPANPEWAIEVEIATDCIIHADVEENMVHIIGNSRDTFLRRSPSQHQHKQVQVSPRGKLWSKSESPLPIFVTSAEFARKEDAEDLLQVLLSTIKKGKEQGWGGAHFLHRSNLKE